MSEAVGHGFDFAEVADFDPAWIDAVHSARLFEKHGLRAAGSPGLPEGCWLSRATDKGVAFLAAALDATGGIGRRGTVRGHLWRDRRAVGPAAHTRRTGQCGAGFAACGASCGALGDWRPVAGGSEPVIGEGLPFRRNKARQYGLI